MLQDSDGRCSTKCRRLFASFSFRFRALLVGSQEPWKQFITPQCNQNHIVNEYGQFLIIEQVFDVLFRVLGYGFSNDANCIQFLHPSELPNSPKDCKTIAIREL